ncbi:MAG: homocysteine S-methyltransferase [Intestinibaculum porci]|uniref:homocysteine S-methyltransferase n=1 Tax=Intestinibaculum porci TaxID=2487118 RepID=UPI002409458D|nr:homocysteine S-methyltransferase [Intestinibaculum porci]MDD6423554.1 homocysteine S-methyltransferase [Intestinibaculum porci]
MNEYFVIDGAMSSALEELHCPSLNNKLWTASVLAKHPELIKQVHYNYFEAGADCGITASYQASIPGLLEAGYSLEEAEHFITLSVDLFKQAREEWWQKADHTRTYPLCLGSVGPYGAYLADGSEYRGHYKISDQELYNFHKRRIELLHEAGADIILFETDPSLREALVEAQIGEELGLDYWISFSCRDSHHTNEGQTMAECVQALSAYSHLKAIGINCTDPRHILGLIEDLVRVTDLPVFVYPNSGEVYDPVTKTWSGKGDQVSFGDYAYTWYKAGAKGVGGCCTTTEKHIKQVAAARDRFLQFKDVKQIHIK